MKHPRGFTGATYSPINPEISPAERDRTRRATARAVKRGHLAKPPACEGCGKDDGKIQAHHPDYRDPMNVKWLCVWCHTEEHRRIGDAAEFGVERRNRAWRREYKARHEAELAAWREEMRPLFERNEAEYRARKQQAKDRLARAAKMAADGASLGQIAAAMGITLSGASRLLSRNGIKGSWAGSKPADLDPAEVRRMAASGETQSQISKRFGISATTICKFMQRHRIPTSRSLSCKQTAGEAVA